MKNFKAWFILFQIFAVQLAFGCTDRDTCDDPNCAIQKRIALMMRIVDGVNYYLMGGKSCDSIEAYSQQNHKLSELNGSGWKLIKIDENWLKNQKVPTQKDARHLVEQTVLSNVYGKELEKDEYSVSCGPISIAMAYELMGHSNQWPEFIKSFPCFFGGVFPQELVSHLDSKKLDLEPSLTHVKADDFLTIMKTVRREVDRNRPVMLLLVPSAISQHYVNLVGYNDTDKKVLVLDPSGKLKVFSYDWLEKIMYAGVRTDLGGPFLVESIAVMPLMMACTSFGYYNAFTFDVAHPGESKEEYSIETKGSKGSGDEFKHSGKVEYSVKGENRHLYIDPEGVWYTTIKFPYPKKREIKFFSGDEQIVVKNLLKKSLPKAGTEYRCGIYRCSTLTFDDGNEISIYSQDVNYLMEQFI